MGKSKNHCDLCHVKNKTWSEGRFFGIGACRNHSKQPLIVLNEHRAELDEEEVVEMERLAQKHWPGSRARGKGMRSNRFHAHEHYIKTKSKEKQNANN